MTDIAPSAPEKVQRTHDLLMAVTCRRLDEHNTNPTRPYAAWLAAVRTGISPSSETLALGATARYTTALRGTRQQAGSRRAAAIRATHKDVRQRDSEGGLYPLGRTLAQLHHAEHGTWPGENDRTNQIIQQVNVLPLLDVEAAAQVLSGLIGRCTKAAIPVDFYDLANTLIFWGNGISPESARIRRRIVTYFYDGANAN